MRHRIKASLFTIAIVHIVLGGAAIHAAIAWVFDNQDHRTANSFIQVQPHASLSNASATDPVIYER
jgi:flagellar basal body-associated protein FliL